MTTESQCVQSASFYNPNLHLFIDDHFIEHMEGLSRKIGELKKEPQPVLVPEFPWEDKIVMSPWVIYDHRDRTFKMWYQSFHKGDPEFARDERTIHCYAVSNDGIHWEKPVLGWQKFRAHLETNIIPAPQADTSGDKSCVPYIVEENEDGSIIYRSIFYHGRKRETDDYGISTATSTDGFHWSLSESKVLPQQGDACTLFYDEARNKYVIFTRSHNTIPNYMQGKSFKREVAQSASNDFNNFPQLRTVLVPDQIDREGTEFNEMLPMMYGDMYLGFVQVFYTQQRLIEIQLVTSRDGENWDRDPDRNVFLTRGEPGSWDCAMVHHCRPVRVDNELWFWYSGTSTGHWEYPLRGAIGLARLRLDGFAYIDAQKEGFLQTKIMDLAGKRLKLNASAEAGYIKVGILDSAGNEIPGFSIADCDPVTHDSISIPASWNGSTLIPSQPRDNLKLKIEMKNARLYSLKTV